MTEPTQDQIVAKIHATKERIIRALMCAAGQHEAWERDVNYTYKRSEAVHISVDSDGHGDVYCSVCKHCRTLYVRRVDE